MDCVLALETIPPIESAIIAPKNTSIPGPSAADAAAPVSVVAARAPAASKAAVYPPEVATASATSYLLRLFQFSLGSPSPNILSAKSKTENAAVIPTNPPTALADGVIFFKLALLEIAFSKVVVPPGAFG